MLFEVVCQVSRKWALGAGAFNALLLYLLFLSFSRFKYIQIAEHPFQRLTGKVFMSVWEWSPFYSRHCYLGRLKALKGLQVKDFL